MSGRNGVSPTQFALELLRNHQAQRALDVLTPLLASSPTDVEVLRLAAVALLDTDRPHDALPLVERAAQLAPGDVEVQRVLAITLARTGRSAPAKKVARGLAEQSPDDPRWLMLVADVAATTKDRSRYAVRAAERAVALAPLDPSSHHALGRLRLSREEVRRAKKSFEAVLRLDPFHETARFNLAVVQSRSLDPLGAARQLADLGRTSSDRTRDANAFAGVMSSFVYPTALAFVLSASIIAGLMPDPAAHPIARWVIAVAGLAAPVLVGVYIRLRLGPRTGSLIAGLWHKRPFTVIGACFVALCGIPFVLAAVDPVSGLDWYRFAMLPGVLGGACCVISRLSAQAR